MENELKIFSNNEFGEIRITLINNIEWFVGKDVAEILGYADPNKAINMHVDDEDKLNDKTASSLGQRGGWFINESGLYSLILSSKLPNAKKFKKWVTSEVLPSLRKTGGYVTNDELFISTYLPFADDETKLLFRTTLATINNQNKLIQEQKREISHKSKVIDGFTKEISLADKRQLINKVVRFNANGNYQTRWVMLYSEFEQKYHMNLKVRIQNHNANNKPKIKNKLDYIEKVLEMIPELYEIAAKLFESDIKVLIEEMYSVVA